jgi:hypothetical protein
MRYCCIAIAILAAACGSSTPEVPGQQNCTATLSGGVTASNISCFAAAGDNTNGNNKGGIGFSFTGASGYSVSAAVVTVGAPTAKEYKNTDSGANGGCTVTSTGSSSFQGWAATAGSSNDQGTYDINVTSLSNQVTNPDGGPGEVFLTVHGSVNCTMPAIPGSGATGTVTLSATF